MKYYYDTYTEVERIMSDVYDDVRYYKCIDLETGEFSVERKVYFNAIGKFEIPSIKVAYEQGLITPDEMKNRIEKEVAKQAKLAELAALKDYVKNVNQFSVMDIHKGWGCAITLNVPCTVKGARKYKGDGILLRFERTDFGTNAVVLTTTGTQVSISISTVHINEDALKVIKEKLMEQRQPNERYYRYDYFSSIFPYMEVSLTNTIDESVSGKRQAWKDKEIAKLRAWVDTCERFKSLPSEEKDKVARNIFKKKYGDAA